MKKIVSLMLVAVMMVMTLTSCDLVDKLFGNDTETRYTITEEEWNTIMAMKNYTVNTTGKTVTTGTMNGETQTSEENSTVNAKFTEDSQHHKSEGTRQGGETFVNEYYYATKDGVKYRLNADGSNAYEYEWESETFYDFCFGDSEVAFEDLTYDEAEKAYKVDVENGETTIKMTIYFENGMVVKAIGEMNVEQSAEGYSIVMSAVATMTVSETGTTVVEVPEFTVE